MTLGPRVALHALCFTALLVLAGCSAVFSVGAAEAVDFSTLVRAETPNQYLLCPAKLCDAGEPDQFSPTFETSAANLRRAWDDVAKAEPRTERLGVFLEGRQVVDVQRSAVFRFPDVITAEFIQIDEQRATLAIYSRSVYGRSDFGVNGKRVTRWLADLAVALEDRTNR